MKKLNIYVRWPDIPLLTKIPVKLPWGTKTIRWCNWKPGNGTQHNWPQHPTYKRWEEYLGKQNARKNISNNSTF